jgi:hypothetical protein
MLNHDNLHLRKFFQQIFLQRTKTTYEYANAVAC